MLYDFYFRNAYNIPAHSEEPATPRVVMQDVEVQTTEQARYQHDEAKPDTRDVATNATVATRNDVTLTDVFDTTGKKTSAVQTHQSTLKKVDKQVQHGAPHSALRRMHAQSRPTSPTPNVDVDITYDLADFGEEDDSKIHFKVYERINV